MIRAKNPTYYYKRQKLSQKPEFVTVLHSISKKVDKKFANKSVFMGALFSLKLKIGTISMNTFNMN
jgi:hypothetical protein